MSVDLLGLVDTPGRGEAEIEVLDPATGAPLAAVADRGADDGTAAVDRAERALGPWRARAPRERAEILRRCYETVTTHTEQLAELITAENGKTLADARAEIAYAAEFFRWFSEEAVRAAGTIVRAPSGGNWIVTQLEPVGVSVLVTPWNFPAAMATRKIAPALAAGCTVVLKPAAETPLTAFALAALCREAGVPDGVISIVTTSRPGPVVAAMLHHPAARALSFTGSSQVGRLLLREAADRVVKSSMELGGNAPFLVFADADLTAAVDGLMIAKMRNGGQACTAANRIYVQRPVAREFGALLTDRMALLRVGPGGDKNTECGPLISDTAVLRVAGLVEAARHDGADLALGGTVPDGAGSFYPPTVLQGVRPTSDIVSSEIFGPVAAVQSFTDEEEVVSLANATDMGLAAYVYAGDLSRALRVAGRLDSGMVAVNRGLLSDPAAAFGGTKQSGLGREGGHDGLLEFSETKYIAVDW